MRKSARRRRIAAEVLKLQRKARTRPPRGPSEAGTFAAELAAWLRSSPAWAARAEAVRHAVIREAGEGGTP